MVNDHTPEESPLLRMGIVGWGWMGQVHARAYARLRQHYPEAPLRPTLVAVADAPDDRLANAIDIFGSVRHMRIGTTLLPETISRS